VSKAIEVKNVNATYGKLPVLHDINFSVNKGDIVYILGGNGSGKSTLIKTILGLIKPKSGSIEIMGQPSTQKIISKYIGYVPQTTFVERDFPITVEEIIQLECNLARQCDLGVSGHLSTFDSEHLLKRKLSNLSGGEFQKVLIARALVTKPDILIMDEPTNNLDQEALEDLITLLDKINKQGKTIIIVTHDETVVRQVDADVKIFELKNSYLNILKKTI